MAYWHEPKKHMGGWTFPPKAGSRVGVVFRGEDVRIAPFEGHFMRYEGDEPLPATPIPAWNRSPDDWFELHPRQPLLATSMQDAKEKFAPLLPQVEAGAIDEQMERKPYRLPIRPTRIKEIEHPTRVARAVIVQHSDGPFEVHYYVYAPNGRYFPASTPSISSELEWEWGVTWATDEVGTTLKTLADSLASAEEIAETELHIIAEKDSEIKHR